MRKTVADVLEDLDIEVQSLASKATVFEAITFLQVHNLGAVAVVDDGSLVGIFSERDYARKVALSDRDADETTVGEVMTPYPFAVTPDQALDDCAEFMIDGNFRHLPVLKDGELVGVVSVIDVLHAYVRNQATLILDLEQYADR